VVVEALRRAPPPLQPRLAAHAQAAAADLPEVAGAMRLHAVQAVLAKYNVATPAAAASPAVLRAVLLHIAAHAAEDPVVAVADAKALVSASQHLNLEYALGACCQALVAARRTADALDTLRGAEPPLRARVAAATACAQAALAASLASVGPSVSSEGADGSGDDTDPAMHWEAAAMFALAAQESAAQTLGGDRVYVGLPAAPSAMRAAAAMWREYRICVVPGQMASAPYRQSVLDELLATQVRMRMVDCFKVLTCI
jgi:hypothetical protein